MGVFDLPTTPDVPALGSGSSGGIFSLPASDLAPALKSGGIFSIGGAGAVSSAVSSLKTPAVNIPLGVDITKTSDYVPTPAETQAEYGTATTISQAPKEGFWNKVGDFFRGATNAIFGETPADTVQRQNARNAIVQAATKQINNSPYLDIAKQLGLDQVVDPTLPKGVDPKQVSPDVLQYYKEQAAANVVKNNWSVIQKNYPDVQLPAPVTAEQVDKQMGVDPSSPLGKVEGAALIFGSAALADSGIDILGALTEGGIKASIPQIVSLAKNVGIFTALDKVTTPLREEIAAKGNLSDGEQALLYVAQQAGNILATHGASKGVDKMVDLFAKHTIEGFMLPKTATLSGEDIKKILQTKGITEAQFNQMADDLGWGEAQKAAIKNGGVVTMPSYKVVTTADRPWWGKVKDLFGFEPSSETTITKSGGGIEPIRGQVGEPAPSGEDLMSIAKQIKVPTVATSKPSVAENFARIAARSKLPVTATPTVSSKILVGRHGDIAKVDEGIAHGQTNDPLTAEGITDAQKLGETWKNQGVKKIISSDLPRGKQTAEIASKITGAPTTTDPRLRTWDIGEFDGKPKSEVDPKLQYYRDHPTEVIPGGESFKAFTTRVTEGLKADKAPGTAFVLHNEILKTMGHAFDTGETKTIPFDGQSISKSIGPEIPNNSNSSDLVYHTGHTGFNKITDFNGSEDGNEVNRFGPGLYVTDDKNVAKAYASVASDRLGRGNKIFSGSIRPHANILDLNNQLPADAKKVFEDFANEHLTDADYVPASQRMLNNIDFSAKGSEVYDQIGHFITRLPIDAGDAGALFTQINSQLEKLGYDGLRAHTVAPKGNEPNSNPNEIVIFKPKNTLAATIVATSKESSQVEPKKVGGKKTIDLNQLRNMLDRTKQSLDAAESNSEAHQMAYGADKRPEYRARIKDLTERIAEAKNPTFDTGDRLADARKSLNAVLERTGVKPVKLPTIKVSGKDIPLPIDLYEKELNLDFKKESIKENPLNDLLKYANKDGNLPEVTGTGKGKFATKGDDIISREGFQQFADKKGNIDSEDIREKFSKFIEEKKDFQDELKQLRHERRAFIEKAKSDIALKAENERKAAKYGFTIPEYKDTGEINIPNLIAAEDAIRVHPGRDFMKYVNNRTGIIPEIDSEYPGIYGKKMNELLEKKGFSSVADAQKTVDNYIAHVDKLFLMTEDMLNPIELAQANSTIDTNAFQTEKERLQVPGAKPLETMVDQSDKYPLNKKVGAHDYLGTPKYVLEKIGLGDEAAFEAKQYRGYLKELPKNIQKITDWAERVPGAESSRKIFDYLDGLPGPGGFIEADFLSSEEKKIGDEIKTWLEEWANRLHLKPHERLANYITHVFDEDFIKKEFDEDLAKIIHNKIPGEVYDPFLEQRLGSLGYIHDTWRALNAYVKRATRKVYMDPALQKLKVAASELDLQSQQYVLKHIAQVNLRPTDTDVLVDTTIKQALASIGLNPYALGGRPVQRITATFRRIVSRATFGLNPTTALKVLTQGVNTYAELGEKYTVIGYGKLFNQFNWKELQDEGIVGNNIATQDRILSATKKFWEKTDKVLYFLLTTVDNINRGSAYFGAKAKYYAENTKFDKPTGNRIFNTDASELKAKEYARDIAEKTQFMYNNINTPVALGSDINKTLLQFQSFTTKETEFLVRMGRDKNYAGLLRYLAASIILMLALGKIFKTKWSDIIPIFRFAAQLPPIISIPTTLFQAAVGTPDQFGQVPSASTREKNAIYALTSLFPAGVQASKTLSGFNAINQGESTGALQDTESLVFGENKSNNSEVAIGTKLNAKLKTAQTKLNTYDSGTRTRVQSIFNQAKAAGFGTPKADNLVSTLSDYEYKVYNAMKSVDKAQDAITLESKVLPIVKQAEQLGFGTAAADKLITDSFPNTPEGDKEYNAYLSVKTSYTIKPPTGTVGNNNNGTAIFEGHPTYYTNQSGPVASEILSGNYDDGQIEGKNPNGEPLYLRDSGLETSRKAEMYKSDSYWKDNGYTLGDTQFDHIIPLEAGGTNTANNVMLIPKVADQANQPFEDYLGKLYKAGKISRADAGKASIDYKINKTVSLTDVQNGKY